MLEIGKVYRITMLEDEIEGPCETTYFSLGVVEIQWPLARFSNGMIVNLSSPRFVKAEEPKPPA